MKIIDLSINLRRDNISLVPGHPEFELKDFHFHDRDFRSNSFLQMSIHTGTHVDAPYHFIKNGVTIDDLPLEKIVGKAFLLDLRSASFPKMGILLASIKQADYSVLRGCLFDLRAGVGQPLIQVFEERNL